LKQEIDFRVNRYRTLTALLHQLPFFEAVFTSFVVHDQFRSPPYQGCRNGSD